MLDTQAEKQRTVGRTYKSVGHELHWDLGDDSGSRCWSTTAAHVDGGRTNVDNSYDIWPPLTVVNGRDLLHGAEAVPTTVRQPCCSWRLRSVLRTRSSTTRSASSSFLAIVLRNVSVYWKLFKCAEVYKESYLRAIVRHSFAALCFQTCHRDSPSRVLAHQFILGQKVTESQCAKT